MSPVTGGGRALSVSRVAGGGRRRVLSWSFTRALIPFLRSSPHDLIASPRSHLLISSHWELGSPNMNLGEHQESVFNIQGHWKENYEEEATN